METAAEEQTSFGLDLEVTRQDDVIDINRDDDFDFEIGGDDDLGPAEAADDSNGNLIHQANEPHDNDTYTYQPQEQAIQAAIVDSYGDESHDQVHDQGDDQVHEDLDFGVSVFDATAEAGDITEPAQDGSQSGYENQGADEEHVQGGVDEDVYYDQNTGEFESFENTTQPEVDQGHGLMKDATSVDYVHEEADLQDPIQETAVETNVNEYLETAAEDVDREEHYDDDEFAQDANVATENAENRQIGGEPAGASLAKNDPSVETVDESRWETVGHEDQSSKARPNVTVSYRGQEYFLFSETPDEDPDTYFLDDVDSIHRPLSQFLGNVREVIDSEVEASHEIFMKIDGLGLEFGESTTKDFLNQTTLAQIIGVNNKLVQHDGGSQSPELYIFLSVRSNPLNRFTELAKGADEGQGLSNFEKYYDEASGDASTTNEDEQSGFPQDMVSDDLSLDDTYDETGDAIGGTVDSSDVQQYRNPFRLDKVQQQSSVEAAISDVGIEAAEHETLATNAAEERFSEDVLRDTAELADGSDHNDVEADATDFREISIDNALADVTSVSGQVEERVVENWSDTHDVESHGGQGSADGGEAEESEKQVEVPIDFPQEEHERTDGEKSFSLQSSNCVGPGPCLCDDCYDLSPLGYAEGGGDYLLNNSRAATSASSSGHGPISGEKRERLMTDSHPDNTAADQKAQDPTTNAADDDDYLDLGDDDDHEQPVTETTNDDATGHRGTPQQTSHNSSATATLDGEDDGHGDDAAATQDHADPGHGANHTEFDTSQPEVDEIDWNHDDDDDDEMAVAIQNPGDLSPSSLSVKRSRQEDGDADGSGDENGSCWPGGTLQTHADKLLVAKRRRT